MNNNERLSVRPTPRIGESLTSFLLRAGRLNHCDEKDIWKDIHIGSQHMFRSNLFYRLDYDFKLINPKKMSRLLDVSLISIEPLSFYTVCTKFFDNSYEDYDRAMVMIQIYLDKHSNKYCPTCFQSEEIYKLIWRLKEIDICPIHNVQLVSNRKLEQGYKDIDFKRQKLLCERWEFLMKPDQILTKKYGKLNLERSLALKLLFVTQNQATAYARKDITGLSKNIVKNLVAFVRGTSNIKKPTVQILFEVLDHRNMTIDYFSKLDVPITYLDSLLAVKEKQIRPAKDCMTPWCTKREQSNMILINERVEPRKKNIRYPYFYICEGCFMRYSYYPMTRQWQEIDGKIELVSSIKRLAELGMTRSEVSRELKINLFRISEVFGYLAYHHLIPDSIRLSYVFNVPNNLVSLFAVIQCDMHTYPESKYKKTRDLYGWTLKMFSYYYAHPNVQLFYIYKSSNLKKRLKKHRDLPLRAEQIINDMLLSNTRISLSRVAASLDCSERTLNTYGISSAVQVAKVKQLSIKLHSEEKELRKKFDNIIALHNGKEIILMQLIYKNIGRSRVYIVEKYPGLINYMTESVKEVNRKVKNSQLQQLVYRIRGGIQQINERRKSLSVAAVASYLGINFINVKGYRHIKEKIKQEINNYSLENLS